MRLDFTNFRYAMSFALEPRQNHGDHEKHG